MATNQEQRARKAYTTVRLPLTPELVKRIRACERPRFVVTESYVPVIVLGDELVAVDTGDQTLRWEKLCALGFRTHQRIRADYIEVRFKLSGGEVTRQPFSRRSKEPVLGVDQNSFCLALALVDPATGNLLDHGIIPIKNADFDETFTQLGAWLARRRFGTRGERLPVAIERLSGTAIPISRAFSRRLHRFGTYRGWDMRYVDPRLSTFIGEMKFGRLAPRPDTSSGYWQGHEAAAYVIARRALGFEESIPSWLVTQFGELAGHATYKNADVLRNWKAHTKHQVWAALFSVRHHISHQPITDTAGVNSGNRHESAKHLIDGETRLVQQPKAAARSDQNDQDNQQEEKQEKEQENKHECVNVFPDL